MSPVRSAYLGILAAAVAWSVLSAVLLLAALYDEDRSAGWFWAASFFAASLVGGWSFWELLGGVE